MTILLWTLAYILWINKSSFSRWFGIMLFVNGVGAFGVVIHRLIMPMFLNTYPNSLLYEFFRILFIISLLIYFFTYAYASLVSAIMFCRFIDQRIKKIAPWILSIPLLVFLIQTEIYPIATIEIYRFRILVGLYFAISSLLYLIAYIREKNTILKTSNLRTGLIAIIINLWIFISEFSNADKLVIIDIYEFHHIKNASWEYHMIMAYIVMGLIIFFVVKYGVLGVKMSIERQKMERTLQATANGIAKVRKSLKIDINKIAEVNTQLENAISQNDVDQTENILKYIMKRAEKMQRSVDQIKEKTEIQSIREMDERLSLIIDSAIAAIRLEPQTQNITMKKILKDDILLRCDPSLLQQALVAVLKNGVEAIGNDNGKISIDVEKVKSGVIIRIIDDGVGIGKEEWQKIFQPFYSLKESTEHLGIGLSFASKIVTKHQGSLYLAHSEIGKGTTVEMFFPKKRICKKVI